MANLRVFRVIAVGSPTKVRNSQGNVFDYTIWGGDNESIKDDTTKGVEGSLRPASSNVQDLGQKLIVTLDGMRDYPSVGSWKLYGRLGNTRVAAAQEALHVEESDRSQNPKHYYGVMFQPPWARKDFPWGFAGNVIWELHPEQPQEGQNPIPLGSTRLEIYGITPKLPSLFRGAVDVAFLRVMVLPARSASSIDWPRYVAKTLFWDLGFRYNTYGSGAASYASGPNSESFHLSRWTRDAGRCELVNCYDQAGITQIALSLAGPGIGKCEMIHMDHFGWINPTELVGRGFTNNPFHHDETEEESKRKPWLPMVAPGDLNRSLFANHSFIRIGGDNGVIIDACAAPHVGNETLQEYIAAAISLDDNTNGPHSTTLYRVEKFKIAYGDTCRRGTPADVSGSPRGVTAIDVCTIENDQQVAAILQDLDYKQRTANDIAYPRKEGVTHGLGARENIPKEPNVSFSLSQFTSELEGTSPTHKVHRELRFNDYGAHVTYDIPYFLPNGFEKDQIDVDIVVLRDNDRAVKYFECHLIESDHFLPDIWKKLEDENFAKHLSLAKSKLDSKHGIIAWVQNQFFFRVEGHPSSNELWKMYGEKLFKLTASLPNQTNFDFEITIPLSPAYKGSEPRFKIQLPDAIASHKISWSVFDNNVNSDDPGAEKDMMVLIEKVDPSKSKPEIEAKFTKPQRMHSLHWNFVDETDSLKVCTSQTSLSK